MKQDVNVYTMMLLASFVALLIGCIALAVELGRYPMPTPWNSKSQRATTTAQVISDPIDAWQGTPWRATNQDRLS
ncbi:MAG: hypothetical protein Q8M16_22815 [Pirellulaceae bacterium]|nr:hypothetical protein [Pirellulaceae bacterium]